MQNLDNNLFLTISSLFLFMSRTSIMMNISQRHTALWPSLNRIDAETTQLSSNNKLILISKSSTIWQFWWSRTQQRLVANRHLNMLIQFGQDISIKYSQWLLSQIKHFSMKWCYFTVISITKLLQETRPQEDCSSMAWSLGLLKNFKQGSTKTRIRFQTMRSWNFSSTRIMTIQLSQCQQHSSIPSTRTLHLLLRSYLNCGRTLQLLITMLKCALMIKMWLCKEPAMAIQAATSLSSSSLLKMFLFMEILQDTTHFAVETAQLLILLSRKRNK